MKKSDEKVMVVARNDLFGDGVWHGIKTENLRKYIKLINSKHKFLLRAQVEEDAKWQQIIPYLIFENGGCFFLMKRKTNHTDRRLSNMYSLGIGGHINEEDIIKSTKSIQGEAQIMSWAKREFKEEIDYKDKYSTGFVGLINDDSNDVGLVHLGLVIRIRGDSDKINVRDEHKLGKMVDLDQMRKYYKNMESWSQIVYDFLVRQDRRGIKSNKSKEMRHEGSITGILPDWLIAKYIDDGAIKITHLDKNWKKQIDQVSIDFHLGNNIKLFRAASYRFIDTKRGLPLDAMEEVNLSNDDPFILEPGAFAITSTREVLRLPNDIVGRLEGKSSLARLGILVHSTAARFDPGWYGAPVLELGNLGPKPAILYCGMPICAFTFEKLASPVKMLYEGSRSDRYSGSKKPVASRIGKHGKK